MTKSVRKKDEAVQSLRMNERKWSKPLMDAGWTAEVASPIRTA